MSKLAKLLDATEPLFSASIRSLEKLTGEHSTDVTLLSEMQYKAISRMNEMKLNTEDTTPEELFHGLQARIAEDNIRLAKLIGGKNDSDVRHLVPLMIKAAKESNVPQQTWALKGSVAKKLIREMPPKKMMEHLGYRSIDSLLKRENLAEIYSALRFIEGDEWLDNYNTLFKSVTASDFETRDIQIIEMDHDKWVDVADKFVTKKLHNVTHTKEMGTIVVVPMHRKRMKGLPLKTLALLFHYINEVRLYSSFFKLKSTSRTFGADMVETLIADPSEAAVIAGKHIHWRVIQRYFGKIKDESHPSAFEPHVHPEDLHWRRASEALIDLDPELEFWRNTDYVLDNMSGEIISFNLTDVSFGYSNEVDYKSRYVYHGRESLWNEIFMRYMGQGNLEKQILEQLDNDLIKPEELVAPKREY
ncbi:hypothetical protein KBC31_03505 [Candidatus Saccharibacteria bacterium]|jgi:hypothetical protein|nr:hypothetical protein [Candidatus Saccharibacteria bacterium]